MESKGEPRLRPSPDQARASLEDVHRMEADLADRLVTPWWYHPGAATAVLVFLATVVLGRRADAVVRHRLRHGARTR
jgi:hypothetical protein